MAKRYSNRKRTHAHRRRTYIRRRITRRKQRWISRKIRILRHEGYPQRQAIAIAHRMAGVARPRRG